MVDKLEPALRSENMRRIRSKDMKPEMVVRSTAHRLGYRFRIHYDALPGKPDLVFPSKRKIIFVHGCFWHGHEKATCVDGQRKPKSNLDYWLPKLTRNQERDRENVQSLENLGWSVLTIWECETHDRLGLLRNIKHFIDAER